MSPWRILFINPCLRKKAPTEILPMGLTDKTFIKPGGYKKHTTIKKINWTRTA